MDPHYPDWVFEVCDSDAMDFFGVYIGANDKTSIYIEPDEVTPLLSFHTTHQVPSKTPSSSSSVPYISYLLYAAPDEASDLVSSIGSCTSTDRTIGLEVLLLFPE